jgi:hypothetical protein
LSLKKEEINFFGLWNVQGSTRGGLGYWNRHEKEERLLPSVDLKKATLPGANMEGRGLETEKHAFCKV